jgi:polyhydroxyalkanoate synthesis regulator phasin
VSGIDEDAYDKYTQRASDIEQAQSDLVDGLVKDGKIDADTADSAVKDYRKAQALNDLSQQIRNTTKGRAGFDAEQVNVSSLRDRVNKLYDSGRLEQALGEDGASRFMQQISEANRVGKTAISRAQLVKNVAKWAGVAGVTGAVGGGLAHVLGGNE